MEEQILGFIPQEWLDVGLSVKRPNDPLDSIIGDERTGSILARWQSIAAEYQIPVMANFHGFDTEANRTFRVPVDSRHIEKGLIKVKLNQSERMRELTRAGVREGDIKEYVLQDGVRLADQVATRSKVAKAEMMATGKVTIKENNLDLTVDYGVPADQTGLELDLGPEADVHGQLQDITAKAEAKGLALTGLLTSRVSLAKLRQNKAVQGLVAGSLGGGLLSRAALESYLADEFGITTVLTDDLSYGVEGGIDPATGRPQVSRKRYFPEDKVSFFAANAAGKVGAGLWGDPPEAELPGFYTAGAGGERPFVYVIQKMEWDPAVLWTKASGLFMPVLYNPAGLWIAGVKKAE